MKRVGIDIGSDTLKAVVIDGRDITPYGPKKVYGKPISALKETLEEIAAKHSQNIVIGTTGVNSAAFSDVLKQAPSEPIAIKEGISFLGLDVSAVIEVGASTQRYLEFKKDNGRLFLENYDIGDKCGGGSGLLLEHMAQRFGYDSVEELSRTAYETTKTIGLSTKCGVFRESDVVHQQQKGTPKRVLAASLYRSSAISFSTILSNGIVTNGKIAIIGGLSLSEAFIRHLKDICKIDDGRILIPKENRHIGAIGAAQYGIQVSLQETIKRLEQKLNEPISYKSQGQLIFEKSRVMQLEEN